MAAPTGEGKTTSLYSIIDYLNSYCGSLDEAFDNTNLWVNYIKNLNRANELTDWTVVVSSLEKGNEIKLAGMNFYKSQRSMMPAASPVICFCSHKRAKGS